MTWTIVNMDNLSLPMRFRLIYVRANVGNLLITSAESEPSTTMKNEALVYTWCIFFNCSQIQQWRSACVIMDQTCANIYWVTILQVFFIKLINKHAIINSIPKKRGSGHWTDLRSRTVWWHRTLQVPRTLWGLKKKFNDPGKTQ